MIIIFALVLDLALAITPEQVVQSSLKHYPDVINGLLAVEENEARYRESRGVFDAKIKGEGDIRTEGYYGGDFYKAEIEKPLPFLNSRLYAGNRQSYGSFPVYEGKYETLSRGENYVGAALSLLRDNFIDLKRYKIRQQEQQKNISKLELDAVRLQIQTLALKAYWSWVIKGHQLKVYREILDLALKRADQLERRIKMGDLARIYKTENLQYIRKREVQFKRAEYEFRSAAFYLSLYYRNDQGEPRSVENESPPDYTHYAVTSPASRNLIYQLALSKSLELQKIEAQKKQAELGVQLGWNEIMPKLDVQVEWNQDQGRGPQRLMGQENRVLLTMEVPIEYRKGVGLKNASEAQRDQMDNKLTLEKQKIKVSADSLFTELTNTVDIFQLSRDEVEFSRALAKAEYRKFSQGASDLILVNLREENYAEAQIKNLDSYLNFQMASADLKRLQVEWFVQAL